MRKEVPIFSNVLFILAIITMIAVGAYRLLPEKEWVWVPENHVLAYIYADDYFGGNSTAQWEDEQNLHFSCEIRVSERDSPPFCGAHFFLKENVADYVDLQGFSRMEIEADYEGGNEKLRFYLNEFVPGFSDPVNPVSSRTAKYMGAFVNADELSGPFTIEMDEFIVAEWWVNDNNVPRQKSAANREHILAFGVDIVFPTALGRHDFTLKKVTFYGEWLTEKQWYLGILVVWIACLLIVSTVRIGLLLRYNSRLQTEKSKYEKLSMIDALTGLLNRYGLLQHFHEQIKEQTPIGMLLLDIDHFKPINDCYGHHIGDVILQRIARTVEEQLRKKDKAARWGGEEFLVLLPETPLPQAVEIAERIRSSIQQMHHAELDDKSITISIGVCQFDQSKDFECAFSNADAALYKAKENGRNQVAAATEI